MKRRIQLAGGMAAAFAAACASGSYDRDRTSPDYPERARGYVAPSDPRDNTGYLTAPVIAAIGAVALGANPTYYEKSFLAGRCVIRDGGNDALGAPCNNVVIVLTDADTGAELARKPCDGGGKFAFPVESGRRYRLGAASPRLQIAGPPPGPFTRGQEVFLTLSRGL